jgi:hypothetical protein
MTRCLSCDAVVKVANGKCPNCGSANLHDNRRAIQFAAGCGWYIVCVYVVLGLAGILIVEPIRRTQGWPASKEALDVSAFFAGLVGLVAFVFRLLRR